MKHWRTLCCGLLTVMTACASWRPANGPLNEFAFLEGTWAQTTARQTTEEVWTLNEGWSMRGVGRTLQGEREVFHEVLSIEPRGKNYVYVAELPGAGPVEFKLVDRGIEWARFENPEHDFPQRIEYRRNGNSLRAEVSGVENGRIQREIIEYRRVAAH